MPALRLAVPRLAALLAVALAGPACKDGGAGPTDPAFGPIDLTRLQASCAYDSTGRLPCLTVLARATPLDGPLAAPITATLRAPRTGGASDIAFGIGGNGMGLFDICTSGLRSAVVTVGAVVDGKAISATCTPGAGLPALHPTATAAAASVDLAWPAVTGAVTYHASLVEPATSAVLDQKTLAGTSTTLAGAFGIGNLPEVRLAAYSVTPGAAIAGPLPTPAAAHASFIVTSGATGGDGSSWQVFRPADFNGSALTVSVPALAADEQLAVLLVNAGGTDGAAPTLTIAGTGTAPLLVAEPQPLGLALAAPTDGLPLDGLLDPLDRANRAGAQAGREALRRWDEARLAALGDAAAEPIQSLATAPIALAVLGATRTFCHAFFNPDGTISVKKAAATLRHQTAKAQFWVTDAAWNGDAAVQPPIDSFETTIALRPDFWTTIGDAYDGPVTSALGTYFGAQSDVDANGQMMFVFANLGVTTDGGFPVGYFTTGDFRARDLACTGSGSNFGDILYLTDPTTFTGQRYLLDEITDVEYPGTMAHELQHNVNYNVRCRTPGRACTSEDAWLNEGLSMVSEDLAGYGLAETNPLYTAEFNRVGTYFRLYRDFSLTAWEADPAGNYGGVHAFMRYWLDQGVPDFTKRLVEASTRGRASLETVVGASFATAMIRFANAAVFSGETFSPLPQYDYATGVPWSPLHHTLYWRERVGGVLAKRPAYVDYTPLPVPTGTAFPSLRQDGWGVYLTGKGTGGPATLTVSTAAAAKPHVVVVRFAGTLPRTGPF